MANARRDDWLTDAQGRALSGAAVYYCYPQPATTSTVPPSPLASIFSNIAGTTLAQPVLTDGFGHAVAYADSDHLYTIVFIHPLFGANPIVLTDQSFGGGGGGGSSMTAVACSTSAGTITGAIDGANVVFTLPSTPNSGTLLLQYNGVVLTQGLGYAISGVTLTLAVPPSSGDNLAANYFTS